MIKKRFFQKWDLWLLIIVILIAIAKVSNEVKNYTSENTVAEEQSSAEASDKSNTTNTEEEASNKNDIINYVKETSKRATEIGNAWVSISEITNKGVGYVYSDTGKIDLSIQFTQIKLLYDEIEELSVPKECEDIHIKWVELKQKQIKEIDLFIKGLDDMDADAINESNNMGETTGPMIQEITKENEKILNKFK